MADFADPFIIVKAPKPESPPPKKRKTVKRPKKERKNCWNQRETKQYVKFFKDNSQFIQRPELRKSKRIFNQLHKYIPSRTPVQIKSHHQKLLIKYKNIDNVIKTLEAMLITVQTPTKSTKSEDRTEQNQLSNYFIRQAQFIEQQDGSELLEEQSSSEANEYGICFFDNVQNLHDSSHFFY